MDKQKVDAFFNALIDRTKRDEVRWDGVHIVNVGSEVAEIADFDRSFYAKVGSGEVSLIMGNDGQVTCYVKSDLFTLTQSFGEPDNPVLLRLYNIVYTHKPQPFEKFINSIIDGTD